MNKLVFLFSSLPRAKRQKFLWDQRSGNPSPPLQSQKSLEKGAIYNLLCQNLNFTAAKYYIFSVMSPTFMKEIQQWLLAEGRLWWVSVLKVAGTPHPTVSLPGALLSLLRCCHLMPSDHVLWEGIWLQGSFRPGHQTLLQYRAGLQGPDTRWELTIPFSSTFSAGPNRSNLIGKKMSENQISSWIRIIKWFNPIMAYIMGSSCQELPSGDTCVSPLGLEK